MKTGMLIVLITISLLFFSGCSSSSRADSDAERAKLQEQIHGLVNQISALNRENERLRRQNQELSQQLSPHHATDPEDEVITQRKLAHVQAQAERLTAEQDKLVQQLVQLQQQLAEREGEREELLRSFDALRQAFVREMTRLQEENERLHQEQAQWQERLERDSKALAALSLQELSERARALQGELQELQGELARRKVEEFRQSALQQTATCKEAQAESVTECLEQQIALAVELTKRGSVTRAVAIYEQILNDYPDLAISLSRIAQPITAAEVAWELSLLRESIARSTISDLSEQIKTRLDIWQAYLEAYPDSPYTDDALWRLAFLSSNSFRWSGANYAHYDPTRALEHLKQILELSQMETTDRLSDLWRGVAAPRALTRAYVFEMIARGYEIALQDCRGALAWYERALAETADEQKKTDLTATVLALRESCE